MEPNMSALPEEHWSSASESHDFSRAECDAFDLLQP